MDLLLKQILPFKGKGTLSWTLAQQRVSLDEIARRMERLADQSRRVTEARHWLVVERPKFRRGWPRLRWRQSRRGGAWATWERVAETIADHPAPLRCWYTDLHTHVLLLNAVAAIGATVSKQLENTLTTLNRLEDPE